MKQCQDHRREYSSRLKTMVFIAVIDTILVNILLQNSKVNI